MNAKIDWIDGSDLDVMGVPWGYRETGLRGDQEPRWEILPTDDAIKQDSLERLDRLFYRGLQMGDLRLGAGSQIKGRTDAKRAQDAAEVFWTSELEALLAPIMRRPKTTGYMVGPDAILPIRSTIRPGQLAAVYDIFTTTGQAAWVEPNGMRKLPQVGEFSERKRHSTGFAGIGYGVGLVEMWQAAERNQPLESMRRMTAEGDLMRFAERTLLYGDVGHDAMGWLRNSQAYHFELGANFTSLADDPDGAQVQLQKMEKIFKIIGETYAADAPITNVLAPRDDRRAFERMRWANDTPAWPGFVQMHPWLGQVRWAEHIETSGGLGGSQWVLASDDPSELWSDMGTPMLFGPWQDGNTGLRRSWAMLLQITGVILRRRERVVRFSFAP
jgi:hypothetical protein